MTRVMRVFLVAAAVAVSTHSRAQQTPPMTFFITSAGPGQGADLGGLAGADAHLSGAGEGRGRG